MKIEFKSMRNILKLLVLIPLLTACDDFLTPAIENIRDISPMTTEPAFAQGIMLEAYNSLPYNDWTSSEVATDNAVSNDINNAYLRMATSSWSSFVDPMNQYQYRQFGIQYVNLFLQGADSVKWASDPKARVMFRDRLKGEAYALRGLQLFGMLQAHGGWTSSGKLMGVPIVRVPQYTTSNFNLPRNTFQACVDSINADFNRALNLLPLDFVDVTTISSVPAKYQAIGVTNISDYNRVFGALTKGRMSSRIVKAIAAQVALLAASPAYAAGTTVTWANAADKAALVVDDLGGVAGLNATGWTWFDNRTEINGLAAGSSTTEIIWRNNMNTSNNFELDNYPPSVFGNGRINPSQNLVDAFYASNGYPISNPLSLYNPQNPYTNRDPRLGKYIVYNGSVQASTNGVITTGTYGTNNDALNRQSGASTRTGYYLRKFTRGDVNANPSGRNTQKHVNARIRATELFLTYAEAANEAWGPLGTGTHAYSAYDVIKAIRKRAMALATDPYLESIKSDQAAMRTLIQNERRLELCFENNIRFYDLRRWKVDLGTLNQTIKGMQIDKNPDGSLLYTTFDVEPRNYKSYMYYGPIPYTETLKWNLLEQNAGW
jgi:starch-binding outer membrane protein, SusD/RagB family